MSDLALLTSKLLVDCDLVRVFRLGVVVEFRHVVLLKHREGLFGFCYLLLHK